MIILMLKRIKLPTPSKYHTLVTSKGATSLFVLYTPLQRYASKDISFQKRCKSESKDILIINLAQRMVLTYYML